MSIIEKIKSYVTGASIAGVAYTPKTEYKGSLPKSTVRSGSKGADVTAVQTFLNWGIGAGLVVDAIAGPKTVAAIKVFQKQSKITADGIFGPNTKTQAQALINKYKKKPTPPKKTYKVIDVSEFQDSINWAKAKADGVQGAIIRCGLRGAESGILKTDSMFLNHIKGAYKAGLPVGIYMFTEAVNAKEGKEEAQYAIKLWKTAGVPISYPIGIDSEDVVWKNGGKGRANHDVLSKAKRTEAIKAFAEECKRQGYKAMLYASTSWLNHYVDMKVLEPLLDVWCAQYYSKCEYKGKHIMWQYTSSGKVSGARGDIDMNHCYIEPKKVNPPKTVEKKGYSGTFPSYRLTKNNAKVIADAIKWAKWIAGDKRFHYGYGEHAHHNGCFFCGTQHLKRGHGIKEFEHTYCCNAFVGAAWAHGGGDATAYKLCHECNSWGFAKDDSPSYEKSSLFDKVALKSIKAGDVLCSDSHVALYVGNGEVVQASGGDDNVINSKSWNSSISVGTWNGYKRAYRYNGSVNTDRPISHGEVSDRVADLQKYLNWYNGENALTVDGIFGDGTLELTKAFQEKELGKSQADGFVGPKTIEKMKAVRK